MEYRPGYEMRKEYRLVLVDDVNQLHHINCSENQILVVGWSRNFPGGFSLDTLHDLMEAHEDVIHNRYLIF